MRGPPLCVSQWGAGKNEFMAKSFLQKITGKLLSLSSPHYGAMGKTVKRDLQLIKMNFGAKKFFEKKILKNFEVTFASPGPHLALKHPGFPK